jgi:hypothetical protein
LAIVREKVKPERERNNRQAYRDYWWHYAEKRPGLYAKILARKEVLVLCRVTKFLAIFVAPAGWIYSVETAVFDLGIYSGISVLQCSIYETWVRKYTSTLETRLRFSPSDCFETFPFPESTNNLNTIGSTYYTHRQSIMHDRQEGLTKTYNRFHNPNETAPDIQQLRSLHIEMDQAVAIAYGWQDLELEHGFHKTKQGDRFTISENARREVLDRLLQLNHDRYAEEVKQGLHDKKKGKGKTAKKQKAEDKPQDEQISLF